MEALKEIQTRFYNDFPPHAKEQVYGFATPSTMKPTQWFCKLRQCKLQFSVKLEFAAKSYFPALQILGAESIKFQPSARFLEMSGLESSIELL